TSSLASLDAFPASGRRLVNSVARQRPTQQATRRAETELRGQGAGLRRIGERDLVIAAPTSGACVLSLHLGALALRALTVRTLPCGPLTRIPAQQQRQRRLHRKLGTRQVSHR